MFTVNAVDLRKNLIDDMKVGLVPMVASSPGMGKSDIIRSIAKEFNLHVIDLRMSQCEPVDMQGYPDKTPEGRMTFNVPEYFPMVGDTPPDGCKGWLLFLDEFNSGNKQTEAAGYKLILDRAVYLHKLNPLCAIVAAGNLITDDAIVTPASTATTSRLVHYRLEVDHRIWLDWAIENGIDHRVISFLKFKPELLHRFLKDTDEYTFSCPRTWEFASRMVNKVKDIDERMKIRLAGTVGAGAATEFTTFTRIYESLPTIESVLSNPTGWKLNKEPSVMFALTTMFSAAINLQNIDKLIVAIERLPLDFQVVTFKDFYKRSPDLKDHDAVKSWITRHADLMF